MAEPSINDLTMAWSWKVVKRDKRPNSFCTRSDLNNERYIKPELIKQRQTANAVYVKNLKKH